nr:putative disease resistance protein [Quercus suber]
MAESVVSGVATRLGDLLEQEAKFLYGVSDQVQQLQTELKRMQCFLKEADARQHESEIVMQGVAELRDLAYDAEDIIATYALKVSSNKGGGVQKALKRFSCILGEGITVHQLGSKIADIMSKLSNLRKSFEDNGIRESIMQGRGSSSLNETQREQRETYPHPERIVVGLEDDTNKLVAFLLKEEGVASICDQRDDIRTLNNAMLVEKIRQVQQEQTCLVILDDIWKIEDWNILREVFPMENTDSKILLSSRNKNLALYVDPRGLHELQCLNKEKSWELLEKIAISWRSVKKRTKLKSRLWVVTSINSSRFWGRLFTLP